MPGAAHADHHVPRQLWRPAIRTSIAPTTTSQVVWPRKRRTGGRQPDDDEDGGGGFASRPVGQGISGMAHRLGAVGRSRYRPADSFRPLIPLGRAHSATTDRRNGIGSTPGREDATTSPRIPTPLPTVPTPASRADNASAASTVYAVRYHTADGHPAGFPRRSSDDAEASGSAAIALPEKDNHRDGTQLADQNDSSHAAVEHLGSRPEVPINTGRVRPRWQAVPNPFKRKRYSPPPEVRNASMVAPQASLQVSSKQQPVHSYPRWDLKSRLGAFAAEQGERIHERSSNRRASIDLPVTFIPAQPRGRAWSPETMRTPSSLKRIVDDPSSGPSATASSGSPKSADTTSRAATFSDSQRGRIIKYADQESPTVLRVTGSSQRTSAATTSSAAAVDIVPAPAPAPATKVPLTQDGAPPQSGSDALSQEKTQNSSDALGGQSLPDSSSVSAVDRRTHDPGIGSSHLPQESGST